MLADTNNLYFDWITRLVFDDINMRNDYYYLLQALFNKDFYYTIPLDENRYADGMDLRYRFCYDCGFDVSYADDLSKDKKCSILEMMVALCLRCEENIMSDPEYGNRTSMWFIDMLRSLKLHELTNSNFDLNYINMRLDIFLNHDYEHDGEGGLFTIVGIDRDMRSAEIWYQMCWYLNSL